MLMNNQCSSGYNRVGDFLYQFGIGGKKILHGNGLVGEVSQNNPTPECEVNGTECSDS